MARPPGKVVFLVAGGLFALIGLDLAVGSIHLYHREQAFHHALTTDGIVAGKESGHTSSTKNTRSLDVYNVSANYKINKRWYHIEQSVSAPLYQSVQTGSAIPIFYLPNDPSDGVIVKPSHQWLLGLLGVPAFLVGAIVFIIGLRGDAP